MKKGSAQNQPDGTTFDQESEQQLLDQGAKTIRGMYAAFQMKRSAKTPRELADAIVRFQEAAIREMLDGGIRQTDVLNQLVASMPSISKNDFGAALDALRHRRIRERKKTIPEKIEKETR